MSDYLWDKTGEPDADVEQLENLLGTLKHQPRPLDIPLSAMPTVKATRPAAVFFSRPRLAIAASLLLTLLTGLWFVTRQGETQKHDLAKSEQGSEGVVGNKQTEKAVVINDMSGDNALGNNTEIKNASEPKPREDEAVVVRGATADERQRAPRRLIAKRQKSQPRLRGVADAPAPRVLIAANGEMRWEAGQPMTPEQREATEKLMLALQVASAKFNYAQREMREMGRAAK